MAKYGKNYIDSIFASEFLNYAEKRHLCENELQANAYTNATVLPYKTGRGGGY